MLAAAACRQSTASAPQLVLDAADGDSSHATIKVVGLAPRDVAAMRAREMSVDEWHAILRVTVSREDGGVAPQPDLPAVAGAYAITGASIVFTPMFGLDPGRRYAATYTGPDGARVTQIVSVPKPIVTATTVVDRVYPSGELVPENQLRLYVTFSAPMGMKGGLDYIQLLDGDGRVVKDPFLPVDAEFWNGDRTRFTMFFDPGRVKRGILPNEEMGRPLVAGRSYTLLVRRHWPDAQGLPLKQDFRRTFRVGPADTKAIDPATWDVRSPAAGGREPLVVTFPEPLDHGLLVRALGVSSAAGEPLAGDVAIADGETRWRFTPRDAWRSGDYRLVVLTILEDRAGNRIGRAFEVDQFERIDRAALPESIAIPFRIGGS